MTRDQAWKKLVLLYGEKRAAYRVEKAISSPEKRQQARDAASALFAKRKDVQARRDERERELLSDPLYQELKAETKALQKAENEARGESLSYRFTVGRTDGMFFHVEAHGDTWEECFKEIARKKAEKTA